MNKSKDDTTTYDDEDVGDDLIEQLREGGDLDLEEFVEGLEFEQMTPEEIAGLQPPEDNG